MSSFRSRVGSRAAKVSAPGGHPALFLLSDTGLPPACRHHGTAHVLISWLTPRTPTRSVLEDVPSAARLCGIEIEEHF